MRLQPLYRVIVRGALVFFSWRPAAALARELAGLLVDPVDGVYPGALTIEGPSIVSVRADEDAPTDVLVFPGFVDLQVYDDRTIARNGVTGYLKATRDPLTTTGELCLGLHLEGPFLNPEMAGPIPAAQLAPVDLPALCRWLEGGRVRLVTISPELPGGLDAIKVVAESGAVAAVGHTNANAATTRAAVERGARFATHLWNAMAPVRSRATGPVPELLLDDRVTLGLNADGRHLHPRAEELTVRVAGSGRIALTSDLVPLPAERAESGKLLGGDRAGASLVARASRFGLREAAEMASLVPARLLGLDDRGRLAPGRRADIAVLSAAFAPLETVAGGESVWSVRYARDR
jgi:N-acetylglucosamine-6-phosphate deacetylase